MTAKQVTASLSSAHRLLPWLVKERYLRRYLGRALDACDRGRVIFFYHRMVRPQKKGRRILMMLVSIKHDTALSAALNDFCSNRFREIKLEYLVRKKK